MQSFYRNCVSFRRSVVLVLLTFLEKFTFSLVSGCCQDKFEHYWKKKFWFVTIPSMCPLFIFRVILLLRQRLYIVWKHNNPQHSQQLNPIHSVESFPYSVKQKLSYNFCFIFSIISFTLKYSAYYIGLVAICSVLSGLLSPKVVVLVQVLRLSIYI